MDASLDHDACYRAVQSRDARFDGRFFTAVATTGIYCRPVCPARTPLSRNVTFYACAAAAEGDGYRPCKRCRPESAPGSPAWRGSSATVDRAVRLINEGALDHGSVDDLADRLGVGPRHLRRLMKRALGATPVALAQTRRAHFALKLLHETHLPMADVALAAGFASVRRFNAVMRKRLGDSPRSLRRARRSGEDAAGMLRLRLAFRPPLAWAELLQLLARRADPAVEQVVGDTYRRVIPAGTLEVAPAEAEGRLELRTPLAATADLMPLVSSARRRMDLDADPRTIAEHLARDARLRPLVRATPGLRLPGPWELADADDPWPGDPDASPPGGLPDHLTSLADAWRPWRGYAALYLSLQETP